MNDFVLLLMRNRLSFRELVESEDYAYSTGDGGVQTLGNDETGVLVHPAGTVQVGGESAYLSTDERNGSTMLTGTDVQVHGVLRIFPASPAVALEINGGVLNPQFLPPRERGIAGTSPAQAVVGVALSEPLPGAVSYQQPFVTLLDHTHVPEGGVLSWSLGNTVTVPVEGITIEPLFGTNMLAAMSNDEAEQYADFLTEGL